MDKVKKVIRKLKEGFVQKAFHELSWIYHNLAECRKEVIAYTGMTLVSMLIAMSFSFMTKNLVDDLISENWTRVIYAAVYYVTAGLINVSLAMGCQRVAVKVKTDVRTKLSINTYKKIIYADWETVIQHHSGDLLTRMQEDIIIIADSTVGWIPAVLSQCLQIAAAVFLIVYYDYSMIFIVALVAPIVLLGSRIFLGKMYKSNQKQREISSKVMSLYKESFQHLQAIKGFGLGDFFIEKMRRQQYKRKDIDVEVNKYSIASWSVMYISGQVSALICLAWALFHVYQGKISLGIMALLIVMASTISSAFKSFIQQIPSAVNTISASERIRAIIDLKEELLENEQAYQAMFEESQKSGISIGIKEMDFSYQNGQKVFENVSCKIGCGETVAFVGPSGEGKTTMLRILLGIVKTEKEPILYTNGMDLPVSPAARRLMAYVPQGNTMMNGTIAENLRMFNQNATDEEIVSALKAACAYDFVEKLPEGIYHNIGESGVGFSEGQNQRLSIARALMCNTPILLLDEATSALDVATERKVLANLMKGKNKKTCIITTHRPSVLSMCDRIYRIADGNVKQIDESEIQKIMNEF